MAIRDNVVLVESFYIAVVYTLPSPLKDRLLLDCFAIFTPARSLLLLDFALSIDNLKQDVRWRPQVVSE